MGTIRWGIVGCGDVTEVKSGPALQKASNSALVAVMRRDADKARDYAVRHGVPRWYADGRELIDDPEVDAVYVATPPSSHEAYARSAAEAGKPAYVEKPMGRTHAECLRMVEAARSARGGRGVPLFVAYYRRALPRFLRVKRLLDDGAIGPVRFVSVALYQPPDPNETDRSKLHWHVVPEIAGAGRFLDLASHMLDLLDFCLGPITDAGGDAANQGGYYDAEDLVTGHWTHAGGARGVGTWCFTAGARADRTEIVGAAGTITFSCFGTDAIRLQTADGQVRESPEPTPPHIQQPLIQTVVDELNGVGRCPSNGETAARTSWAMDQMLKAWRART